MVQKNKNGAVLITGASSGIGYELSKCFAKNGYPLILTARNEQSLDRCKVEMEEKYHAEVSVFPADLSVPGEARNLYDRIISSGLDIDVLVNNAGAGICGLFHETGIDEYEKMIQLNITSCTALLRLVIPDMIRKKQGHIINIASTGAFQPGPYIAVYYASKAYLHSLSMALANELKDFGITVTSVCPGATRTNFSNRAGKADIKNAMDPAVVAEYIFRGFQKKKSFVIPGTMNKIAVFFSKLLPDSVSAKIVRKIQQDQTQKHQSGSPSDK